MVDFKTLYKKSLYGQPLKKLSMKNTSFDLRIGFRGITMNGLLVVKLYQVVNILLYTKVVLILIQLKRLRKVCLHTLI